MVSGMRVKLHRNLNAPNKAVEWSITPMSGELKGRVVAYCSSATVEDVEFRAQPAGTAKIRETGVRSVVAWVVGELVAVDICRYRKHVAFELPISDSDIDGTRVTFNPFSGIPNFVVCGSSSNIVTNAECATLTNTGQCWAKLANHA